LQGYNLKKKLRVNKNSPILQGVKVNLPFISNEKYIKGSTLYNKGFKCFEGNLKDL
jgi:hypothetical protein